MALNEEFRARKCEKYSVVQVPNTQLMQTQLIVFFNCTCMELRFWSEQFVLYNFEQDALMNSWTIWRIPWTETTSNTRDGDRHSARWNPRSSCEGAISCKNEILDLQSTSNLDRRSTRTLSRQDPSIRNWQSQRSRVLSQFHPFTQSRDDLLSSVYSNKSQLFSTSSQIQSVQYKYLCNFVVFLQLNTAYSPHRAT